MFKRLTRSVSLAILLVLVISSLAFAVTWTWRYPTIVSDTGGVARTYYPVYLGYGSQNLIDTGKINANGLNTNMQIGAISIKYMMGTTRVMAVTPSLLASSSQTVDLYTGYSPAQTSFPIIVGENGYVTTTDVPELEPGGNFILELVLYLNETGIVFNKEDALKLEYNATTDELTLTCGDSVTPDATITASNVTSGLHTIQIAVSITDGAWEKYTGNPVDETPTALWEVGGVASPDVIKIGDTYYMYYQGDNGTGNIKIGLATSSDLVNWTHYSGNPILTTGAGGAWDDNWVSNPTVFEEGGTYYMFYEGDSGTESAIGYATSPDGITWTKNAGNPVLQKNAGWDGHNVGTPSVIKEGATYYLFYHGGQDMGGGYIKDQIGVATSANLNAWVRDGGNPIVPIGAGGTWDDYKVGSKEVIKVGSTYVMVYEGADGALPDSKYWQLGLATSTNLTTWTKYTANPIIANGGVGTWDNERVSNAQIFYENGTYYIFYSGGNDVLGGGVKIGFATSTDPSLVGSEAIYATVTVDNVLKGAAFLDEFIPDTADDWVWYPYPYFTSVKLEN
jgi:predicted GH43/DUF377 family glycosyl hydrolase